MKRRTFIQQSSILTGAFWASGSLPLLSADLGLDVTKITILHTNDVHSRIEPFPMDGGKQQGRGGAAKRAGLINQIRQKEKNVLLFDCGDMFQGTPYFNFFSGELEVKLMSKMGYDGGTIGNHDFDLGLENLEKQLRHANFPIIISNYELNNTPMNGKTVPYKIFNKGNVKIGVFGVGIEMNGLVPKALYGDAVYLDPLKIANKYANTLKNDEKCDYVVCLSHLGFKYGEKEKKISDVILAKESSNIDLILGGHTHTFLNEPEKIINNLGKEVLVHQVGWGGLVLGRIDITFERNKKGRCITCQNTSVG
jgi:5'-nucleotidase